MLSRLLLLLIVSVTPGCVLAPSGTYTHCDYLNTPMHPCSTHTF